MREYFQAYHAERAIPTFTPAENAYYLPHHSVIRRDAVTTKLRVVFDASSHVSGQPSLNDVQEKGPKLDADLLNLLLTFRRYSIFHTADIRKAYLQISILPEDRDALRFLWIENLPNTSVRRPLLRGSLTSTEIAAPETYWICLVHK